MLSRRNFLRSGTLSAVSVGLAVGGGRMAFGESLKQNPAFDFLRDSARSKPLFNYNRAAFESAIGSTFTSPDSRRRPVNLTLVSVTAYQPVPAAKLMTVKARPTDSFALSFSAARELRLSTTIYQLDHPVLGKFDLFMTARKTKSGTLVYEAIVNHAL